MNERHVVEKKSLGRSVNLQIKCEVQLIVIMHVVFPFVTNVSLLPRINFVF